MTTPVSPRAANEPWRLPPRLFDARCRACWFVAAVLALVAASFWSLELQWRNLFSAEAARAMGRFFGEFFPPDTSPAFLHKVAVGAWEEGALLLFLFSTSGALEHYVLHRTHREINALTKAAPKLARVVLPDGSVEGRGQAAEIRG